MTDLPMFPTSVVGSLPRPSAVRALLGQADAAERLDAAIRDHVALCENDRIDIMTEGEWPLPTFLAPIKL